MTRKTAQRLARTITRVMGDRAEPVQVGDAWAVQTATRGRLTAAPARIWPDRIEP
jgi:hypothetical protein